jgi:hypothetical protein
MSESEYVKAVQISSNQVLRGLKCFERHLFDMCKHKEFDKDGVGEILKQYFTNNACNATLICDSKDEYAWHCPETCKNGETTWPEKL